MAAPLRNANVSCGQKFRGSEKIWDSGGGKKQFIAVLDSLVDVAVDRVQARHRRGEEATFSGALVDLAKEVDEEGSETKYT